MTLQKPDESAVITAIRNLKHHMYSDSKFLSKNISIKDILDIQSNINESIKELILSVNYLNKEKNHYAYNIKVTKKSVN